MVRLWVGLLSQFNFFERVQFFNGAGAVYRCVLLRGERLNIVPSFFKLLQNLSFFGSIFCSGCLYKSACSEKLKGRAGAGAVAVEV